jgi:hypothetical protein
MNMGDDISADFKWTEMCRVQSTLLMGERLISATVGSPEHTECNSRVQAVRGARQSGDSRQCHRQTEGDRSIQVPVDGTVGRTYRRGASLSTHLLEPCCKRKLSNQHDLRGRSLVGSSSRRSSPNVPAGRLAVHRV